MTNKRLCVLGECMLEVSAGQLHSRAVPAGMSYGGDTLNTSVYYARMGGAVNYLTALGDDSLSAWMLSCWSEEGVGCDWVQRVAGAAPGLYLIQLDDHGERSFVYWRDQSPARALLQSADKLAKLLADAVDDTDVFYLSGITLSLMSEASRRALFEFTAALRLRGGLVAFDSNHRPRLWPDEETARLAYDAMYRSTDIALSTADDEYVLFGGDSTSGIVERLHTLGVDEIVVKDGNGGCALFANGTLSQVPALAVDVVDTTAAGDSFNAAYLRSRVSGLDPVAAVGNGHALASTVIRHRGAIIPAEAMPDLEGLGGQ